MGGAGASYPQSSPAALNAILNLQAEPALILTKTGRSRRKGAAKVGVALIVIVVVLVIVVFWFIGIYNRLVGLRNNVEASWKQVDVQLQKRYDLIPNLVETVKGYAAHEKDVFEKVTQARASCISAQGAKAQGEAENMLTGALKSLFAVAEAYPELKANQNFLMLQQELANIENKVAYSRQHYNDVVRAYNTLQQQFPANMVAGMASCRPADYFEIEVPEAREVPKVSFD